jgi:hypothetical protein
MKDGFEARQTGGMSKSESSGGVAPLQLRSLALRLRKSLWSLSAELITCHCGAFKLPRRLSYSGHWQGTTPKF